MGENICKLYIDKSLISKIYKELQLNSKKKKKILILKMNEGLE